MQTGLSLSDWVTTLSLVFGGCCSNAVTMEKTTFDHPRSAILSMFLQFLFISIYGLPLHVAVPKPYPINGSGPRGKISLASSVWSMLPRLKPRRVPLLPYAVQVVLFYALSTLNSSAFSYHIPMTVHIIFRSGGLIVNIVLGWFIAGKKYTISQVLSVCMVAIGIALSTISTTRPKATTNSLDVASYTTGILMLTVALLLSGILGLLQEWTFKRYIQPAGSPHATNLHNPTPWQESMFYLHFLAMPLFYFSRQNLYDQFTVISNGPKAEFSTFLLPVVRVPLAYGFILLNTLTSFLCVSGVNRMTGRVSSLSVTLILAVRKAVSVLLSVLIYGGRGNTMMWSGVMFVLLGTVGYSWGSTGTLKEPRSNPGKKVKSLSRLSAQTQ